MNRILLARGRLGRGRRTLIPYQIVLAPRPCRAHLPEGGVSRHGVA